MFKLAVAALAFAAIVPAGAADAEGAPTYAVVGTGDSILHRVRPRLERADRWFDTEGGRQPYQPGLEGRSSTVALLPELIQLSQPGGWIVVQDGGSADPSGVPTTDDEWRAFIRTVIQQVPDDRCLLLVLPAHLGGSDLHDEAERRRNIILDELASGQQPCAETVDWYSAVDSNPSLVDDGLHPADPAGTVWLAEAINGVIG